MDIFAEHRDMIDEQYLAVIDTETNMFDEVRRDLSRLFSPAEYKCPTLL